MFIGISLASQLVFSHRASGTKDEPLMTMWWPNQSPPCPGSGTPRSGSGKRTWQGNKYHEWGIYIYNMYISIKWDFKDSDSSDMNKDIEPIRFHKNCFFFFHFRFCSRWRMSGCVSCLFRRDGDAAAQQNNTRAHGQGVGGVDKSLSEDFQHMLPNLVNIEKTIENGPVEIVDFPIKSMVDLSSSLCNKLPEDEAHVIRFKNDSREKGAHLQPSLYYNFQIRLANTHNPQFFLQYKSKQKPTGMFYM